MVTDEYHISYQTSGRYYTYGNPKKSSHLLIALHGYGQLASFFIRKFYALDSNKYFVICPEAPNRFYQKGTSGRVGASWMTKEDRLTDIKDYINFLNTLYSKIINTYEFKEKTLLGFSQGGATASRWIGYGNCEFDKFMLWAAVFPPDMKIEAKIKFKSQQNYFIIGDQDEYTTLEQAKRYHNTLTQYNIHFKFIKFEGNHTVKIETLQNIIE